MNKQEENHEDLLKKFINPGMIERAPEGFTTNVMNRIRIETEPVKINPGLRNRSYIPVVSAAIALILIGIAFLLPGGAADALSFPLTESLKNIKLSLPEISFANLFRVTLPSVVIYVFIGILVLSLFDRALYGVFHREK
jgi:hypothetical protein